MIITKVISVIEPDLVVRRSLCRSECVTTIDNDIASKDTIVKDNDFDKFQALVS